MRGGKTRGWIGGKLKDGRWAGLWGRGGWRAWGVVCGDRLLLTGPGPLGPGPKTQSLGRLAALLDTDVFTDWLLDSTKLFYGQCYFTRQCFFLRKAVVYERKYSRTKQAF